MLESGGLLCVVSRKRSAPPYQIPKRSDHRNRIAITRDGSGVFPLDRSSIAGCQFFGFHGVNAPMMLINLINRP
ncbi:unknown protein [Microcystis aeruginosa NIES-843]|uniref:Uncharacterized protein n=1 Tax=Microcystis aeruginosa (strain NIES-843 / IAM M-2473) TaxID=449447 RepID=B0JFS3_MICAN|nr:unknown protein [Microcystis aeruginosa NIES-843]